MRYICSFRQRIRQPIRLEEKTPRPVSYTHLDVYKRQGCEIEEVPRAAVEEERQVLEEASSLAYTGDLEDITLTSDLTADGVIAGSIKETGFWNTKYTVTAGGEDWFYLGDPCLLYTST